MAHAQGMFPVLADPALYAFLDSPPPESLAALVARYARLEGGVSPDGTQRWLNWIVVLPGEGPIGFVQATVAGQVAWVAYLLGQRHWSRGYATEATRAMLADLVSSHGTTSFNATVELANERSIALLHGLDFRPAGPQELSSVALSPTERLYVRHVQAVETVGAPEGTIPTIFHR